MGVLDAVAVFVLMANYFGLIHTPTGWIVFWSVLLVADGLAMAWRDAK